MGYSPWDRKESGTTEQITPYIYMCVYIYIHITHTHTHTHSSYWFCFSKDPDMYGSPNNRCRVHEKPREKTGIN